MAQSRSDFWPFPDVNAACGWNDGLTGVAPALKAIARKVEQALSRDQPGMRQAIAIVAMLEDER
jgi:hypothetical protein